MRILHINDTYKPVGGTEVYLDSLSSTFKENGHEIFLFSIDDEKEIEESNLFVYKDIFKRSPSKYILWYYFNPSLYNRLQKWIKMVNPDIIHIHNNGKFASSILLALNGNSIPVVQTVHDHTLVCPTSFCINSQGMPCEGGFGIKCPRNRCISWARYAYQQLPEYMKIHLLKKNVSIFIAPSRALQNRLINNGFQNVIYFPNFVDVNKFKYDLNKMESCNVLYVGRLSIEKGVNYILEAFPKIVQVHPSCILNIIGDGPLRSNLFHLARNLGIEKQVIFHGRLSGDPLIEAFQKANVVVIPSIVLENSPIVAYEAMASGRPIVGSNIGGIPDLVMDGETGFLVEPGNSDQIAEEVIKLLSDRELAIIMGNKAKEYCFINYNKEYHYKKLKIIYENVIQGKIFSM
jgi:glycosyltransferase involved in cell wall biosynthesis